MMWATKIAQGCVRKLRHQPKQGIATLVSSDHWLSSLSGGSPVETVSKRCPANGMAFWRVGRNQAFSTSSIAQASNHDIVLESWEVHDSCIVFRTRIGGIPFHLTRWSLDGGMKKLQEQLGDHFDKVAFFWFGHEIHRYITLDPKTTARDRTIDFGPFNCFVNEETAEVITNFWRMKMWNQWCRVRDVDFEDMVPRVWLDHGIPQNPTLGKPCNDLLKTKGSLGDRGKVLALCGGGKDTLLVCTLLEQTEMDYGLYHESYSVYGSQMVQHKTMDEFRKATGRGLDTKYHNHYVMDDFYESPASQCLGAKESHMGSIAAGSEICGCPGSGDLFSVLLTMIQHGYSHLAVGYEKSAEVEDSNQASKTVAWQEYATDIIRKHIIDDFAIYSPIAAFHDTVIFHSLGELGKSQALQYTSSCNISKPWCKKCAKCATVWLGFRCYCWSDEVDAAFGNENLLDSPDLEGIWKQVTQVSNKERFSYFDVAEAQLMLHQLAKEGVTGRAIDLYNQNPMSEDTVAALVARLTEWDPKVYGPDVSPKLSSLAQTLLSRANTTLRDRLDLPMPIRYLYSHEEGGANWDALTEEPAYYPVQEEKVLLREWEGRIKESLKDVDVLIELCPGSGENMRDFVWGMPNLHYVGIGVNEDLLNKIADAYPKDRTTTLCVNVFDEKEDFRWMDELRRKHIGERVAVAYLGSSWSNHYDQFSSGLLKRINHRLQSDLLLTSFDMWECDPKFDKKELLRAAYDNKPTAKFITDGYLESVKQARLNGDKTNSLTSYFSPSVTNRLEDALGENLTYSVDVDNKSRRVKMFVENTTRPNDRTLVEQSRKYAEEDVDGLFEAAGMTVIDSNSSPSGFRSYLAEQTPIDSARNADATLKRDGFVLLKYDSIEDTMKTWGGIEQRSSLMWEAHPLPWVRNDIVRRAGYARRKADPEKDEVGLARSTNHDGTDALTLGLHHDFLGENFFPKHIAFRVERPTDTGGESLICDMTKVRDALQPQTVKLLQTRPLRYNFALKFDSDEAYSTDCFLGTANEGIALSRAQQAFGHNQGFHTEVVHDLSEGSKSLLVSFETLGVLRNGMLHENLSSFGVDSNNTPYWAEYADGSGNLCTVVEELRALENEKMNCLKLETGDILVFSNIRCKHGRNGFTGDRRVYVLEI